MSRLNTDFICITNDWTDWLIGIGSWSNVHARGVHECTQISSTKAWSHIQILKIANARLHQVSFFLCFLAFLRMC